MAKISLARVKRDLEAAAHSIKRMTEKAIRDGKPVPYGTLTVPTPNTTPGRTPAPFTGGN